MSLKYQVLLIFTSINQSQQLFMKDALRLLGSHNILENIMHSECAIGRISAFIIMTSCNRVIILPDTMTSRACSGSRDQLPLQMEEKKQIILSHITFGLLEIRLHLHGVLSPAIVFWVLLEIIKSGLLLIITNYGLPTHVKQRIKFLKVGLNAFWSLFLCRNKAQSRVTVRNMYWFSKI